MFPAAREFERIVVAMDQRARHAAIAERERVARRFAHHATVGAMSIVPDIFAQRSARRIGPPRRALRRDIGRAPHALPGVATLAS